MNCCTPNRDRERSSPKRSLSATRFLRHQATTVPTIIRTSIPLRYGGSLGLLNMDRRDVWMVILFAFVAGMLTLASPLAIESLVNVVSWGIYVQPLIVLAMVLLVASGWPES